MTPLKNCSCVSESDATDMSEMAGTQSICQILGI